MRTTSAPARRRSLGMRRLQLHRDDHGWARRKPQAREVLAIEVQSHGLLQVPRDLVQRAPLGHDRDLETLGYVAGLLTRANHRLDRMLKHASPLTTLSIARG